MLLTHATVGRSEGALSPCQNCSKTSLPSLPSGENDTLELCWIQIPRHLSPVWMWQTRRVSHLWTFSPDIRDVRGLQRSTSSPFRAQQCIAAQQHATHKAMSKSNKVLSQGCEIDSLHLFGWTKILTGKGTKTVIYRYAYKYICIIFIFNLTVVEKRGKPLRSEKILWPETLIL